MRLTDLGVGNNKVWNDSLSDIQPSGYLSRILQHYNMSVSQPY